MLYTTQQGSVKPQPANPCSSELNWLPYDSEINEGPKGTGCGAQVPAPTLTWVTDDTPEGGPDLQQEPEPELEPQPRDGQLTDLEEVQQQLEHQLSGLRNHRDWSASKMQKARMIPHLDPPLNGRPVAIVNEYKDPDEARFGMVWALGSSGTTEAPIILCDQDDMDDRGYRWLLISDEDPDADPRWTYAIEYQFDGNGQRGMRLGFHGQTLKLFQPGRLTDQGCRWKVVPSGNGKYSIENMHSESTGMRIGMSSRNVKMFPQSQMNDGGKRWSLEYSPN